jgi:hypothetical protein
MEKGAITKTRYEIPLAIIPNEVDEFHEIMKG